LLTLLHVMEHAIASVVHPDSTAVAVPVNPVTVTRPFLVKLGKVHEPFDVNTIEKPVAMRNVALSHCAVSMFGGRGRSGRTAANVKVSFDCRGVLTPEHETPAGSSPYMKEHGNALSVTLPTARVADAFHCVAESHPHVPVEPLTTAKSSR